MNSGEAFLSSSLSLLTTLAAACLATPVAAWNTSSGPSCCSALERVLGAKVALPNQTAYTNSVSSYWSAQEESVSPSCVVFATSAQDVSLTLKVLVPLSCEFAVRGGGHGFMAGVANIQDGVTIDLSALDAITLSGDHSVATVGGGQSWGNVYSTLLPAGVTVTGGRSSSVGVGGSTLGDGWGFMSNEAGFACDNVIAYEIVLANGSIVTATADQYGDLFRALKGGGGNFGIVTSFQFRTLPIASQIWAGSSYNLLPEDAVPTLLSATYNFTASPHPDPKATVLVGFGYEAAAGGLVSNIQYVYTEPVVEPAAFAEFYPLPGQLYNDTTITTLPAYSEYFNGQTPSGEQQLHWAISFENDLSTLSTLYSIHNASVAAIADVNNILWSLAFQPISSLMTSASAARGGNMLGLGAAPSQGLMAAIFTCSFTDASDLTRVSAAADALLAECTAATWAHRVNRSWVDLNHAAAVQDPFAGYGFLNQAYLVEVAGRYDPKGVFQKLKSGPFKL